MNDTIGHRVRRIRRQRGLPIRALADLAGLSKTYVSDIETGKRPVNTIKLVSALAEALRVAPSELTKLPVPAPANGESDAATEAIRQAVAAVEAGYPGGMAAPVPVLREQVVALQTASRECRYGRIAAELPGLIRNLHTTLPQHGGELLPWAVRLHVHVTRSWLESAGAPLDLRQRVVFLARGLAEEHDEPESLGSATWGLSDVLLGAGMSALAQQVLAAAPPLTAPDATGLRCALATRQALAAILAGHGGDADAAMDEAEGLGRAHGEAVDDPLGYACGPTWVAFRRMAWAVERGEPDLTVELSRRVRPQDNPIKANHVKFWLPLGVALAQLPRRQEDALRALLSAEHAYPTKVRRNPVVRDVVASLLDRRALSADANRALRGLGSRIGLPV